MLATLWVEVANPQGGEVLQVRPNPSPNRTRSGMSPGPRSAEVWLRVPSIVNTLRLFAVG